MVKRLQQMLLVGLLLLSSKSLAYEVNISVDKNPVTAGDTLVLTVLVNDHVARNLWLPEQQLPAFRVLGTAVSSSTQIVNQQTSRSTEFRTSLQAPSQPGSYQIGPLTVGNARTNQITITVVANTQVSAASEDAFLRVSVDKRELYVQQQLRLTTQLFLAANLLSGNIMPPQLEHADIAQLGKDQETYTMIDGRRYQVFERTYLLTPQRSGDFVIRGPVFQGQINRGRSLSPFSNMSSAEPISSAAEDIAIKVLPVPAAWPNSSSWLPAELVTLSLSMEPAQQNTKVGEPMTLSYRLTALGVQSDLLPNVNPPALTQASVYAEPAQRQTHERNGQLVAQQVVEWVVIPRQAGTLTIPSQSIRWFNTRTGSIEQAQTDPIEFQVAAASGLQPQVAQELSQRDNAPLSERDMSKVESPTTLEATTQSTPWSWSQLPLPVVLLLALWAISTLLGGLWIWRLRCQLQHLSQPATTPISASRSNRDQLRKQLQQACLQQQTEQVWQGLLQWSQQLHQQDGAKAGIAGLLDYYQHAPLTSQVTHLQRCRFAAEQPPWQEGKALWRAFQAAEKAQQSQLVQRQQPQLPPLYPVP